MSGPDDPEGWTRNTGRCPGHLRGQGKRVWVKFRSGNLGGPWPADGRGAVYWGFRDFGADIMEWKEAE